jgi:hypothetical protein
MFVCLVLFIILSVFLFNALIYYIYRVYSIPDWKSEILETRLQLAYSFFRIEHFHNSPIQFIFQLLEVFNF